MTIERKKTGEGVKREQGRGCWSPPGIFQKKSTGCPICSPTHEPQGGLLYPGRVQKARRVGGQQPCSSP